MVQEFYLGYGHRLIDYRMYRIPVPVIAYPHGDTPGQIAQAQTSLNHVLLARTKASLAGRPLPYTVELLADSLFIRTMRLTCFG